MFCRGECPSVYAAFLLTMNQIKLDYQFEAPIEKVWAVLADTASTPEWVHGVKQSTEVDKGPARLGFCWEEKISIDGQNADVSHEFTDWVENKRATIKTGLPMGGWLRKTFQFTEAEGKTQMQIEMTWNLGILEMLAGPAKVHAALEKSLHKTLENWKLRSQQQSA